jgi:hypothetical protein
MNMIDKVNSPTLYQGNSDSPKTVSKAGNDETPAPQDSVVLNNSSQTCTPEIRNKIGQLIEKAYLAEDTVKFAAGLGGITGFGAIAMAVSAGSVLGCLGGLAVLGFFGYCAKKANDEYNTHVNEIKNLNNTHNCGMI